MIDFIIIQNYSLYLPVCPRPAEVLESYPLMLDLAMDLLWPMKCEWRWHMLLLKKAVRDVTVPQD